ncbi:dTDP-4-dehydrorhamnose reductase [Lignipirellula cremea]|uniref:dTDP-4-dehydrorhamnose reductase n=1 Tax=Lignipirellula cremea TaxID=2528010 RepID=A0A518DUD3_9BACT|nr:dTDP-4-dehydrorhamnose reductase [Lignipirellula cremea]QDU95452.1 dTDP-4-dehydrorhamnose reductase [Lignipirellula cremea]
MTKADDTSSRVLVTGASGQLGSALIRRLGGVAIGLTRADLDLADPQAIRDCVRRHSPQVVINAAAYTQVDQAEQESERCFAINAAAVEVLTEACQNVGARLVHISTDYVFGEPGQRQPFTESDPPCPRGVYACSKQEGELQALRDPQSLVIRTCGLYGHGGRNFVETMLRLGQERDRLRVVDDQVCTPSSVEQVAAAVLWLARSRQTGLLHVANQGATTWFGFAAEIFHRSELAVELEPITTAQYGAPAPRPAYSVLDTSLFQSLGGPGLSAWDAALAEYLAARSSS